MVTRALCVRVSSMLPRDTMCMERQHEIRSRDRADDRLTQRSKRCKERQPCSLGMLSNGLCLVEASFRVSRTATHDSRRPPSRTSLIKTSNRCCCCCWSSWSDIEPSTRAGADAGASYLSARREGGPRRVCPLASSLLCSCLFCCCCCCCCCCVAERDLGACARGHSELIGWMGAATASAQR